MTPLPKLPAEVTWPQGLSAQALALPLEDLITSARAKKAFATLEVTRVGELLAAGRDKLMSVAGFGPRTLATVDRALARLMRAPPSPARPSSSSDLEAALTLVPVALLAFPTEGLNLAPGLRRVLQQAELGDLEALFRAASRLVSEPEVGNLGLEQVRSAIDRLVAPALRSTVHAPESEALPSLVDQCLTVLGERQRALIVRRIGIAAEPLPLRALAVRNDMSVTALRGELDSIRELLHLKAASCLSRLFDAAQRELIAHEGVLAAEHIPPGTVLHAPRSSGMRQDLALRLLAFCFPQQLHLDREALMTVPRRRIARIARLVRKLGPNPGTTQPLVDLERALSARRVSPPRGVLQRALERAGFSIAIDRDRGEVVTRVRRTRGDRLRTILVDFGRPLQLGDLLFHYRDRHRTAHLGRILDALRDDQRFLEIAPQVYSLREWHLDELDLVRGEAVEMAQLIVTAGGRHDIRDLGAGLSERTLWLLRDCLARDPHLRSLGRGCFCPRASQQSRVLTAMLLDLRRALGELPRARFLQNQPESQRRLVAHLLRANRLFVELGADRIDLLSNYPFNEQRLARLMQHVEARLAHSRGYATIGELLASLAETELGGAFLTPHLFEDLLRRHSHFEMLPGALVAQPSLGLSDWIRQRMRDVLRGASIGMTVGEILAEAPELAEFEPSLRRLLENDPCVASPDTLHFQIA